MVLLAKCAIGGEVGGESIILIGFIGPMGDGLGSGLFLEVSAGTSTFSVERSMHLFSRGLPVALVFWSASALWVGTMAACGLG